MLIFFFKEGKKREMHYNNAKSAKRFPILCEKLNKIPVIICRSGIIISSIKSVVVSNILERKSSCSTPIRMDN